MSETGETTPRPKSKVLSILLLAAICVVVALIYQKATDTTGDSSFPSAPGGGSVSVSALSGNTFQQSIGAGVHVVDFWAEWCGPCRLQSPIMEQLARRYNGKASVGKVDVDRETDLAEQFNVRSIPTVIVFKNGQETARFVGVTEERELAAAVNKAL